MTPEDPDDTLFKGYVRLNWTDIITRNEPMTWDTKVFKDLMI